MLWDWMCDNVTISPKLFIFQLRVFRTATNSVMGSDMDTGPSDRKTFI